MNKPLYILSFGGGVNTSALFFYLLEKKKPIDLIIFADTGEETTTTYNTVRAMETLCLEKGIEFVRVQSHLGNLYDYYYRKKIVMSMKKRDCTSKFKIAPIRKFLRERFSKKQKFKMYIGITYDEYHRVRTSDVQYITNVYPFVDDKITRRGNKEILKRVGFSAEKSGCKGCIFNKKSTWLKMAIGNKTEFERHLRLDMNNSRYPNITLNPNYPLQIIEKAARGQVFISGYDDLENTCETAGHCFL